MKKNNTNSKLKRFLTLHLPLFIIITFLVAPFLWIFITSLKPEANIITRNVQYIPQKITLENYTALFKRLPFALYFRNSFVVAFLTSFFSVAVASLAAYSSSRFNFKGKGLFIVVLLSIYLFPSVLLLLPLYETMNSLKLLDTHIGLTIAYMSFSIPFAVWLLKGFFDSIPKELEEAAMVDGCTRTSSFIRVILPVSIPALSATFVRTFITAWNEYLFALMLTQTVSSRTLPIGLQTFIGQFRMNWGLLTAGGVLIIIPVIIMFAYIQKYLIHGLTAGAVKG